MTTDELIEKCRTELCVITIGHIGSNPDNRFCVYRGDGKQGYGPTLEAAYEAFLEDEEE